MAVDLERRIPVLVRDRVVRREVVVRLDRDDRARLGRAVQQLRRDRVLGDHGGVHVGVVVEPVVDVTAARNGADAVDVARGREAAVGVDREGLPGLVDLVELRGVLDLPRGGAGAGEGGEQQAEQERDDRHDHQELDQREAVPSVHVSDPFDDRVGRPGMMRV